MTSHSTQEDKDKLISALIVMVAIQTFNFLITLAALIWVVY